MKKLTLLGLAVVLATSSLVMAAGEAGEPNQDKPGLFSRQWTKVKAMPQGYVDANVRVAQWTGEKLGLNIAKVETEALGKDDEGNPLEGPERLVKQSSIQAHPYRATAVLALADLAIAYGLYKLGQKTGVNAKIVKAKDAVCKALGLNFLLSKKESEKSQIATIKAAIAECKKVLAETRDAEVRQAATIKLSELEIALRNPVMRDAALELE